ncbi:hypothetical protein, partial [Tardiphaga sp.]|uniref:hypothetical protein n=1 Tax=Tardiphaga sp. TaxID=1926292 RepID=UPI0037D9A8E1
IIGGCGFEAIEYVHDHSPGRCRKVTPLRNIDVAAYARRRSKTRTARAAVSHFQKVLCIPWIPRYVPINGNTFPRNFGISWLTRA